VGGLLVARDPFFDTRRRRIITFAAQNRLPAICQFRQYAVEGGLISYGPSITDAYRQVGIYTARIPKGTVPADLPIMQPTKFDFLINLKTAKARHSAQHPGAFRRCESNRRNVCCTCSRPVLAHSGGRNASQFVVRYRTIADVINASNVPLIDVRAPIRPYVGAYHAALCADHSPTQ
jgi:hypothetical protein